MAGSASMEEMWSSLQPLEGGFSGETFVAQAAGEESVVRIYGGRSSARGPAAPEIDAAVLELVRGLLPVPQVREVRAGDDARGLPGLLVTERLPGARLDLILPGLGPEGLRAVGRELGVLLGRLGHMVQPRAGLFLDRTLAIGELPAPARDLPAWVGHHAERLLLTDPELLRLRELAEQDQDLLDGAPVRGACLVHGDLNPKNVLVDPETLKVTGLVDWEFAHAGSPYADLGNLLRHEGPPALAEAIVDAYAALMPWPDDPMLLERARAADLFALVELAARPVSEPGADAERALLSQRLRAESRGSRP